MKTHEELKKKVKELISDNKTGKALDLLEKQNLPFIKDELILISSRYSKTSDEDRLGITTKEDTQIKHNKINFDLLALIEFIGVKRPPVTTEKTTPSNNNTNKYLFIIGGILLAILAGFAIMHMMEDSGSHTKASIPKNTTPTPEKKDKNIKPVSIDTVTKVPPPAPSKVEKKMTDYTKYKVGQETDGGIIFYVNPEPTEGRGVLVMAPIDLPEGEVYWLKNGEKPKKTGANRSGLFSGKINTEEIVEQFKKEYPGESNPAKLCDEFISRGLDDWYLPSQMELDLLYNYYKENGKAPKLNFEPKYYWSSTEIYYRSFHDGDFFTSLPKGNSFSNQNKAKIRAIRSF